MHEQQSLPYNVGFSVWSFGRFSRLSVIKFLNQPSLAAGLALHSEAFQSPANTIWWDVLYLVIISSSWASTSQNSTSDSALDLADM